MLCRQKSAGFPVCISVSFLFSVLSLRLVYVETPELDNRNALLFNLTLD